MAMLNNQRVRLPNHPPSDAALDMLRCEVNGDSEPQAKPQRSASRTVKNPPVPSKEPGCGREKSRPGPQFGQIAIYINNLYISIIYVQSITISES